MEREAAEAAAAWWAEQIRHTKPETDGLYEAQTHREAFAATASIGLRGLSLESAGPVTEGLAATFAAELARRVVEDPAERVRLFVDYGPNRTLGEAADAAGLDAAHFPQKTSMLVAPDHILAKAGYGQPHRLVWSAPGWEHPTCGVQEWPEDSDDPIGPKCALPQWHEGGHNWA